MPNSQVRIAVGVFFAVLITCGLAGMVTAEPVAAGLADLAGHREQVLRLLGWCWTGLPFVVLTIAYLLRSRIGQTGRRVIMYVVVVWLASSSTLLPPRRTGAEEHFGSAYPDSRPLSFGWAAGLLPVFGMLFVFLITVLVLKWIAGEVTKKHLTRMSRILSVLWTLLLATGLVVALTAPIP